MPRDELYKRKTKKTKSKGKYEKNGKFNSKNIRKYEAICAKKSAIVDVNEVISK